MAEELKPVKGTSLWKDAWKRLLKNKLAVFGMVVVALMVVAVLIGPPIIKMATGFEYDTQPANGDLLKSFPPSPQHPFGTDDAGRDILARVLQGGRISLMVGIISTIVSLIIGVSYGAIAGYSAGRVDNFMMRIVDIIYAIPYILIVIVLLSVFGGPNMGVLVGSLPIILTVIVSLILLIFAALMIYRSTMGTLERKFGYWTAFLLKTVFILFASAVIITVLFIEVGIYNAYLPDLSKWLGEKYTGNVNQGLSQIFLLFFALGLVSWLTMARIVRGQVVSLKNQEFVLAAKATGVSTPKIIFKHLVPNTLGPVIVYATLTVPAVMLTEAFLSFLGLGVQAPYASWGSLAADGIKNIAIYPWQLIFPGVTMALTLFSLNFLGDGLRDALDPQTRKM